MLLALSAALSLLASPSVQPSDPDAEDREAYLKIFRDTCSGKAPEGGIGQIHDPAIPEDERQEFGWALYRVYAMFLTDAEVPLTSSDRQCGEAIRRGLRLEGLDAGLDEQIASDRLRAGIDAPADDEASFTPESVGLQLMSEFRAVCAGGHPKGEIDRILDRSESAEVRQTFGWTLIRMATAGVLSGDQLTASDKDCVKRVRGMLHHEGLLEGLHDQLLADQRAANARE